MFCHVINKDRPSQGRKGCVRESSSRFYNKNNVLYMKMRSVLVTCARHMGQVFGSVLVV
jgi:hypothetical protein